MNITTATAAKLLRIHPKTVQNYMANGRLPGRVVKHGLSTRFEFALNDVLDFAMQHDIEIDPVEYQRLMPSRTS